MGEAALIMVSCVLFIQMGLSDAVQRALHISLRIASCPKCLTWWICLAYLVAHDYGIVVSVAASFAFSCISSPCLMRHWPPMKSAFGACGWAGKRVRNDE